MDLFCDCLWFLETSWHIPNIFVPIVYQLQGFKNCNRELLVMSSAPSGRTFFCSSIDWDKGLFFFFSFVFLKIYLVGDVLKYRQAGRSKT